MLAAYGTTVQGSGTQQDTDQTQVVAVDTSGRTRWNSAVPVPSSMARVIGQVRGVGIALDVSGDTVLLDVDTGSMRRAASTAIGSWACGPERTSGRGILSPSRAVTGPASGRVLP